MQNALSVDTQPWVQLGRQLGALLGSLGADAKKGLTITSYGTICFQIVVHVPKYTC